MHSDSLHWRSILAQLQQLASGHMQGSRASTCGTEHTLPQQLLKTHGFCGAVPFSACCCHVRVYSCILMLSRCSLGMNAQEPETPSLLRCCVFLCLLLPSVLIIRPHVHAC
jgi:hypothetical protein